jgi:predicted permease
MTVMRRLIAARMRLRALIFADRLDRDLDEELENHVARLTEQHLADGCSPVEARRLALIAMGGVERRKDECRDTRRTRLVHDTVRDFRYAVRILRRSPGFTLAAVISLALGIGANTTIFQLVDALRLRSLPVDKPAELAIVRIPGRQGVSGSFSGRYPDLTYPLFERIRDSQQAFTDLAGWSNASLDLAERGQSRFAENGLYVTGNFFDVLGVRPHLGRLFSISPDVRRCGAPGVVLSHAFWRREFGGDPSVVGRQISVGGQPTAIIGVAERRFFGVEVGRSFDLAVPICAESVSGNGDRLDSRWRWWIGAFGRLRSGWTIETANAHLKTISPGIFRDTLHPEYSRQTAASYLAFTLGVLPGATGYSQLRQNYELALGLLLATAAFVLLIACANLANLVLARTAARSREVVVRLALGASRQRLFRQLLLESLLLAALGTVGAVALTAVLGRSIVAMMSSSVDPLFVDLGFDWRTWSFAAGVMALTCLLFGTAPALSAARTSSDEALRPGGRGVAGGRAARRLRQGLALAQVALSLVLLAGGLVFSRSLYNLFSIDTGFQQSRILELDFDMRRLTLPVTQRNQFRGLVLDRIRTVSGVEAASSAMIVPLVGGWNQWVHLDLPGNPKGLVNLSGVSPGYFDMFRTPLRAGRDFTAHDTTSSQRVAIVNEAFVQRFMPGQSPLGATFRLEGSPKETWPTYAIVGVAANTKYGDLRETFAPIVFLATFQHTEPGEFDQVLMRTAGAPLLATGAVTAEMEAINPDLRFHFHDYQEQLRYALLRERLMAALCGFFAVLATVLATVGVYGLIAYSATRRTHEIGIRLALGAGRAAIVRMILREAFWLEGAGIAIGLLLAAIGARFVRTMVYEVDVNDPSLLGAAALLLAGVALVASFIPAVRASRADVTAALRCD